MHRSELMDPLKQDNTDVENAIRSAAELTLLHASATVAAIGSIMGSGPSVTATPAAASDGYGCHIAVEPRSRLSLPSNFAGGFVEALGVLSHVVPQELNRETFQVLCAAAEERPYAGSI